MLRNMFQNRLYITMMDIIGKLLNLDDSKFCTVSSELFIITWELLRGSIHFLNDLYLSKRLLKWFAGILHLQELDSH